MRPAQGPSWEVLSKGQRSLQKEEAALLKGHWEAAAKTGCGRLPPYNTLARRTNNHCKSFLMKWPSNDERAMISGFLWRYSLSRWSRELINWYRPLHHPDGVSRIDITLNETVTVSTARATILAVHKHEKWLDVPSLKTRLALNLHIIPERSFLANKLFDIFKTMSLLIDFFTTRSS